uniref:Uncharacterized protein n=1 Tax=Human betaherpesvirus 6A TaxID=32603 RepID=A0A2L2QE43_9BETA|nr:hypothetical protein [Human betaherpesvirus 6A]
MERCCGVPLSNSELKDESGPIMFICGNIKRGEERYKSIARKNTSNRHLAISTLSLIFSVTGVCADCRFGGHILSLRHFFLSFYLFLSILLSVSVCL